jgi:hypothetical protein
VRIELNEELRDKVLRAVSASMAHETPRDEKIHASDLTSPLKAYWQRKHPLPAIPYEVGFWLTGRAHHYYLVYACSGVDDTQEASFWSEELQLLWSPDLNAENAEFKTSRRWTPPTSEEEAMESLKYYRDQCLTYAVAKGVNYWHLIVLYLSPMENGTRKLLAPFPEAYTLFFTDEEIENHRKWVHSTRTKLEWALAHDDPSQLELCTDKFCYQNRGQGRGKPALIEPLCKWFEVCKPKGRYDLFINPPSTIKEKMARKREAV